MRHHDATLGDVRSDGRQSARDIFVGETVESVTPDALLIEFVGKRITVGKLGMAAMKGRVETSDLRELRLSLQQHADWREVIWLVQWRERREVVQPLDQSLVDQHRSAVIGPAMHDAMADGH